MPEGKTTVSINYGIGNIKSDNRKDSIDYKNTLKNLTSNEEVRRIGLNNLKSITNEDDRNIEKKLSESSGVTVKSGTGTSDPNGLGDVSYGGFNQTTSMKFQTSTADKSKIFHNALTAKLTKTHLESMEKLSKLDDSLKRIAQFQTSVQANYYKTSLENQGKMLVTMEQIKNALMIGFNINPNTGRREEEPEKEKEMSTIRKLMFGKGKDGVREALREMVDRGVGTTKDNILNNLPYGDVVQLLASFDKSEIGALVTSLVKSGAKDLVRSGLKDKVKSKNIYGMLVDPDTTLKRMLNSSDNTFNSIFKTLLGVDGYNPKKFRNKLNYEDKMKEDIKRERANFDGKAHYALVYLIPSLLKKQLDHMTGGQTADTTFSYEHGKWVNKEKAERYKKDYNYTGEQLQLKNHMKRNFINVKRTVKDNGEVNVSGGFISLVHSQVKHSNPTTDSLTTVQKNILSIIDTIRKKDESSNSTLTGVEVTINSIVAHFLLDKGTGALSSEDGESITKNKLDDYFTAYFEDLAVDVTNNPSLIGRKSDRRTTLFNSLKDSSREIAYITNTPIVDELLIMVTDFLIMTFSYLKALKDTTISSYINDNILRYISLDAYNNSDTDQILHGSLDTKDLNFEYTHQVNNLVASGSSRISSKIDRLKGRTTSTSGTGTNELEKRWDKLKEKYFRLFASQLNKDTKKKIMTSLVENHFVVQFKGKEGLLGFEKLKSKSDGIVRNNIDLKSIRLYDNIELANTLNENSHINGIKINLTDSDVLQEILTSLFQKGLEEYRSTEHSSDNIYDRLKNILEIDDVKNSSHNVFIDPDDTTSSESDFREVYNSVLHGSDTLKENLAREQAILSLQKHHTTPELMAVMEKYHAMVVDRRAKGDNLSAAKKAAYSAFEKSIKALIGKAEFEKLYKELYGDGDSNTGLIGKMTSRYKNMIGQEEFYKILRENGEQTNSTKDKIQSAFQAGSFNGTVDDLVNLANDPRNGDYYKRVLTALGGAGGAGLSFMMGDGLLTSGAKGWMLKSKLNNNDAFKKLQNLFKEDTMKSMNQYDWRIEYEKSLEDLQNSMGGLVAGNVLGSAVNKWMKHNLRFGGVLGMVSNLAISAIAPYALSPILKGAKKFGKFVLGKIFGKDQVANKIEDIENERKNSDNPNQSYYDFKHGENSQKEDTSNSKKIYDELFNDRVSATGNSKFTFTSNKVLGLYKNYQAKLNGRTCAAESLSAALGIIMKNDNDDIDPLSPFKPSLFADIQAKYTTHQGTSSDFYSVALRAISNKLVFNQVKKPGDDRFVSISNIVSDLKVNGENTAYILHIATDMAEGVKGHHAVMVGYYKNRFKYFDANLDNDHYIDADEDKILELTPRLISAFSITWTGRVNEKTRVKVSNATYTKLSQYGRQTPGFFISDTFDKGSSSPYLKGSMGENTHNSVRSEAEDMLNYIKHNNSNAVNASELLKNFTVNTSSEQLVKIIDEVANSSYLSEQEKIKLRTMSRILKSTAADNIEKEKEKNKNDNDGGGLLAKGWRWLTNTGFPGLGNILKTGFNILSSSILGLLKYIAFPAAAIGGAQMATDFVMEKSLDGLSSMTGFDFQSRTNQKKGFLDKTLNASKWGLSVLAGNGARSAMHGFKIGSWAAKYGSKELSEEGVKQLTKKLSQTTSTTVVANKGIVARTLGKKINEILKTIGTWFGNKAGAKILKKEGNKIAEKVSVKAIEALEKAGTKAIGETMENGAKMVAGWTGPVGWAIVGIFAIKDAWDGWREADGIFGYKYKGMATMTQKCAGALAGFITGIIPGIPILSSQPFIMSLIIGGALAWCRDFIARAIYEVLQMFGLDREFDEEEVKQIEASIGTNLEKSDSKTRVKDVLAGMKDSIIDYQNNSNRIKNNQDIMKEEVAKRLAEHSVKNYYNSGSMNTMGIDTLGGGMADNEMPQTVNKKSMSNVKVGELPLFVSQKDLSHITIGGINAIHNGCAIACAKMIIDYYDKEVQDSELLNLANRFVLNDAMISTNFFAGINGKPINVNAWKDKLEQMTDSMSVLLVNAGMTNHFITIYKKGSTYYIGDPMSDGWKAVYLNEISSMQIKHMRIFDKTKGINVNPSSDLLGGGGWFDSVKGWISNKLGISSVSPSNEQSSSVDGSAYISRSNQSPGIKNVRYETKGSAQPNSLIEQQQNLRFGKVGSASGLITTKSFFNDPQNNTVEGDTPTNDGAGSSDAYLYEWMKIAYSYIGQISVPKQEETYKDTDTGAQIVWEIMSVATDKKHPTNIRKMAFNWCGAFVGHCLVKAGIKFDSKTYLPSSQAIAGDSNFEKLRDPIPGSILIFANSDRATGHAVFCTSYSADKLVIIGGNQGIGKPGYKGVSEQTYKDIATATSKFGKAMFVGAYWPKAVPKIATKANYSNTKVNAGNFDNILNKFMDDIEGGYFNTSKADWEKTWNNNSMKKRYAMWGVMYSDRHENERANKPIFDLVEKYMASGKTDHESFNKARNMAKEVLLRDYYEKHGLSNINDMAMRTLFFDSIAHGWKTKNITAGMKKYFPDYDVTGNATSYPTNYANWYNKLSDSDKQKAKNAFAKAEFDYIMSTDTYKNKRDGVIARYKKLNNLIGEDVMQYIGAASDNNLFDKASKLLNRFKNFGYMKNAICGPFALGGLVIGTSTSTVDNFMNLIEHWLRNGTISNEGLSSSILNKIGFNIESDKNIDSLNRSLQGGSAQYISPNKVYMINTTHGSVAHWVSAINTNERLTVFDMKHRNGASSYLTKENSINAIFSCDAKTFADSMRHLLSSLQPSAIPRSNNNVLKNISSINSGVSSNSTTVVNNIQSSPSPTSTSAPSPTSEFFNGLGQAAMSGTDGLVKVATETRDLISKLLGVNEDILDQNKEQTKAIKTPSVVPDVNTESMNDVNKAFTKLHKLAERWKEHPTT